MGEVIPLSAWVHRKREHGQLLFIDVRDDHGVRIADPDLLAPDGIVFGTSSKITTNLAGESQP